MNSTEICLWVAIFAILCLIIYTNYLQRKINTLLAQRIELQTRSIVRIDKYLIELSNYLTSASEDEEVTSHPEPEAKTLN